MMRKPPLRVGLTGGIGSGKSTVARMLAKLGAAVIDVDAVSRDLTASGGAAIAQIQHTFGATFINSSGALDRARMRTLVFDDPSAKKGLESIIHPLVSLESARQAQQAQAQGFACLVFDVPLLLESKHWRAQVDQVLVVDCQVATQIKRVLARNALTKSAVKAIVATQVSREHRLQAADAVLYNDGLSLDALEQEILLLAPCFGLSSVLQPDPNLEA